MKKKRKIWPFICTEFRICDTRPAAQNRVRRWRGFKGGTYGAASQGRSLRAEWEAAGRPGTFHDWALSHG